MKTLAHLVRRDFLDSAVLWGILAVLTFLYLAAASQLSVTARAQVPILLFTMYTLFFISYLQGVWIDSGAYGGSALARFYLQSLPVPRRRMFVFGFVRGTIGGLPLLLGLLVLLPWEIAAVRHQDSPGWALHDYLWLGSVTFVSLFIFQITVNSGNAFYERLRRTTGRGARIGAFFRFLALDLTLDAAPLIAMLWLAFQYYIEELAGTWLVLELPLVILVVFRMRRLYRRWLWE